MKNWIKNQFQMIKDAAAYMKEMQAEYDRYQEEAMEELNRIKAERKAGA